jgi:hypothetical protein
MAIQYYADQDVKGNITASGNGSFTGQVSAAGSGVSAFTTVSGKGYSIGSSRIVYYDGTTYLGNIDNQGSGSTVIRSAGNNTLVLDTSNNATFAGDLTVSGGDIVLGATGRIQGVDTVSASTDAANKAYVDAHDGGAGVYLPLAAGSGSPLTGSLYIPNYIYHNGDTGTYIGYPSVGRFTIATGSATRADFTSAGFSLGDYQTNVSANIILDEDNMGSNSATALVTQQSVKAYVDAHTSGIGGSGTTNSIPMFTPNGTTIGNSAMSQANIGTGTAKRITVAGARMTITGGGGDADGGTLNLTNPSARLGIGVPASINGGEPEAALDVGKNARVRGSLNVGATNEQYLFVSTTGDQPVGNVKMGYYGDGTDYALSGDNTTSCQYTTAFSNGGRLCEDERIMTFKLTRSQIASLASTQKTLIAADSNFNYIVKEAYMYQVNTSPGQAPSFNTGNIVIQYQSSTGGTSRIDNAFELSSTILNQTRGNRKVLFFKPVENAQVGSAFAVPRAAVVLKATSSASNVGSGTVDYYLRLRVKNIDLNDDIVNNAQLITIT